MPNIARGIQAFTQAVAPWLRVAQQREQQDEENRRFDQRVKLEQERYNEGLQREDRQTAAEGLRQQARLDPTNAGVLNQRATGVQLGRPPVPLAESSMKEEFVGRAKPALMLDGFFRGGPAEEMLPTTAASMQPQPDLLSLDLFAGYKPGPSPRELALQDDAREQSQQTRRSMLGMVGQDLPQFENRQPLADLFQVLQDPEAKPGQFTQPGVSIKGPGYGLAPDNFEMPPTYNFGKSYGAAGRHSTQITQDGLNQRAAQSGELALQKLALQRGIRMDAAKMQQAGNYLRLLRSNGLSEPEAAFETARVFGILDGQPDAESAEPKPEPELNRFLNGNFKFDGPAPGDFFEGAPPLQAASAGTNGVLPKVQSGIDNQASQINDRTVRQGQADRRIDTTVRGQDIGRQNVLTRDATQRRGQDISSTTQRRGQDINSSTQRRGQDITSSTARRGQDLSHQDRQAAEQGRNARDAAKADKESPEVKAARSMAMAAEKNLLKVKQEVAGDLDDNGRPKTKASQDKLGLAQMAYDSAKRALNDTIAKQPKRATAAQAPDKHGFTKRDYDTIKALQLAGKSYEQAANMVRRDNQR